MKTALLLFVLLPFTLLSQTTATPAVSTTVRDTLQEARQTNADSIVAFFLGKEIFQQYVTGERLQLDAKNNSCFFQYNFRHPKFSGETFVIAFTLDSAGQFVPGKEARGLIRIPSPDDSAWVTGQQALQIARDQARRIKKRSLRLEWDHTSVSYQQFETTRNFRDINPGNLVWLIDGEVVFRGDRYSGTFQIDVFTGSVARRFAIPWD